MMSKWGIRRSPLTTSTLTVLWSGCDHSPWLALPSSPDCSQPDSIALPWALSSSPAHSPAPLLSPQWTCRAGEGQSADCASNIPVLRVIPGLGPAQAPPVIISLQAPTSSPAQHWDWGERVLWGVRCGVVRDHDLDHHYRSPQVWCLLSPGESWELSTNTFLLLLSSWVFWNESREETR